MNDVFERVARIQPLDAGAMEQARVRQQQLTKPAGSLGRLEEVAIQVAGIRQNPVPLVERKAVIVSESTGRYIRRWKLCALRCLTWFSLRGTPKLIAVTASCNSMVHFSFM